MRTRSRRFAATLVAGIVVTAQVVPGAAADGLEKMQLRPEQCIAMNATPNEKLPRPWHLDRLHMEDVWKLATGKGVTVAVIDTGASTGGSKYFEGRNIQTFDYVGVGDQQQAVTEYDCEHGTKVMALLGAGRAEGEYVHSDVKFAGIAPDVNIVAYRALAASKAEKPEGLEPTITAVEDAINLKVDVINLSQSVAPNTPLLDEYQSVVQKALDAGIVVVASAGNAGGQATVATPPATFDGVISVGMSTPTDASNDNSLPSGNDEGITIGAPGSEMTSLLPSASFDDAPVTNQAYISNIMGTSYAAPVVSGVVALILERHDKKITPAQVKRLLEITADPPPSAVPDQRLGHGIVNPLRALTSPLEAPSANPETRDPLGSAHHEMRKRPDMRVAYIGLGVGIGAVLLTLLGLATAIALPPARRRARERRRGAGGVE